ncbi:hypothetical protein VP02_01480 [Pseudomonas ogarae]|uniref:Uncharacterized protein n=1 Tax=Pseudomonas kilonensis TaxID=132476 RepID=A0A0F4XW26_9PSED|nr:hypothetical protein VP02_01480 [Pseudomonas ogarae]
MLGKGERTTFADDEVIQYAHFDQVQRRFQPCGQGAIRQTGFRATGGVVVNDNGSSCVMCEGALDDLAGINAGAIDTPVKEDLECQNAMAGIEKNYTENFMLLWCKMQF